MAYLFKDKQTAERCVRFFRQNPAGTGAPQLSELTGASTLYLVEVQDGIDGYGHETDDVQFPTSEVEIIRTTTNPQELLSETTGSNGFHSVMAAPLEPTNYPAEAHVVAITDSFNQTFLLTPTPSEVFGTLYGMYDAERHRVQLDQGFTVNGDSELGAYPAPTLEEIPEAGSAVTCRYIKSLGRWFFFKPTGGGGKVLNVYGPALAVTETTGVSPVFYSEFAAGESVPGLSITGISQRQNATGSDTSNTWVQFPTTFTTEDEAVLWWKKEVGIDFPGAGGALYQTGSSGSYSIAPVAYYGKVISDGSNYYLPRYRTINGSRYWHCSGLGEYIYYTSKDGATGWAIGQTLGKWLTAGDTEIFYSDADAYDAGFSDGLAYLMDQEVLAYSKPAWTSSDQFGVYTGNTDAAALFPSVPSVQFGCGRWEASDGRTLSTPFYFVHACDGTSKQWNGSYTCQAFQTNFRQIGFYTGVGESWYYIGSVDAPEGFYKSASAPSTASAVTFDYTPGAHPLKGVLRLVSSVEGTETWEMTLSTKARARYTCATGATSLTFSSIISGDYYFRNISKSGNYWVALGLDSTVGDLVFDGETLDAEAGNDFIFEHFISLTFDQYVQGSEKQKAWVCSPGVIS